MFFESESITFWKVSMAFSFFAPEKVEVPEMKLGGNVLGFQLDRFGKLLLRVLHSF